MEAFTYENIYYDDCSIKYSLYILKPVSKGMKTQEYVFRIFCAAGLILSLVYIFFIKEISGLQKASTDNQYRFDERMLHMSNRGSQSSWRNVLMRCSSANNITDWSYKTQLVCHVFPSFTQLNTKKKLILKCYGCKGTIQYDTTDHASDGFTIRLNDIHLKQYLCGVNDHCCMGNRTVVSNVVHYAWYSCEQLGCVPFLIFMSVPRFIKLCLLSIHGSTLSSGNYLYCFIGIATNAIRVNVRKESPTSIFDHNLKFEDQFLHAKTIKTLTAYGGICLAYDGIILRPLRPPIMYKCTKAHDLIMANKGAVFLRLWYTS